MLPIPSDDPRWLRSKVCPWCHTLMTWNPLHGERGWERKRYCSRACKDQHRHGRDAEAFIERVSPCPNTGCWFWVGSNKGATGYGEFRGRGPAHRAAYGLFIGYVPPDRFVCHRCDVRLCVNPSHLFLGTHMDNVRDCMSKGRHGIGEKNGGGGKLTADDVGAIRALYRSGCLQVDIADTFGITQSMVSSIIRGASWGHLL